MYPPKPDTMVTVFSCVLEPLSSLLLTSAPNSELNDTSVSGPLLFYSTTDGVLRCTAVGALPPPTLRMTIEGEDRPLTGGWLAVPSAMCYVDTVYHSDNSVSLS